MPEAISAAPPAAPAVPVVPVAPPAAPVAAPPVPAPEPALAAAPPEAATTPPPATTGAESAATPSAPVVTPELVQYVQGLESQRAQDESAAELRQIDQNAAQFAQRLQNEQGLTPEQATFFARREAAQAVRDLQASKFRQGQLNAAFEIGQHFGVDPRSIMDLPTPQAMFAAAQQAKARDSAGSELAALKAENAALKAKLAPVQQFASPGVSPQQAPANYIEALKSGKPLPSAKDIDAYTAQYLKGA